MRYSARRKYAVVLRIADGTAKCQAAEIIKVKAHQHILDSSTDEQRRQIIGKPRRGRVERSDAECCAAAGYADRGMAVTSRRLSFLRALVNGPR